MWKLIINLNGCIAEWGAVVAPKYILANECLRVSVFECIEAGAHARTANRVYCVRMGPRSGACRPGKPFICCAASAAAVTSPAHMYREIETIRTHTCLHCDVVGGFYAARAVKPMCVRTIPICKTLHSAMVFRFAKRESFRLATICSAFSVRRPFFFGLCPEQLCCKLRSVLRE